MDNNAVDKNIGNQIDDDKNVKYVSTGTFIKPPQINYTTNGVFVESPLDASDYQSLHSRTITEINDHVEYQAMLKSEIEELYFRCDKDLADECIPEFITLNRKRTELRKVNAYLKHLHRCNTYFKKMAKLVSYGY